MNILLLRNVLLRFGLIFFVTSILFTGLVIADEIGIHNNTSNFLIWLDPINSKSGRSIKFQDTTKPNTLKPGGFVSSWIGEPGENQPIGETMIYVQSEEGAPYETAATLIKFLESGFNTSLTLFHGPVNISYGTRRGLDGQLIHEIIVK